MDKFYKLGHKIAVAALKLNSFSSIQQCIKKAISAGQDQTAHEEQSDLGLFCLLKSTHPDILGLCKDVPRCLRVSLSVSLFAYLVLFHLVY